MKKILFPFYIGKDIYKEAFVSAVKLARNMNAELILLNTFKIEIDNTITKEKYNKKIRDKWVIAFHEVSKFNSYYISQHANIHNELKVKFDHRFINGNHIKIIKDILVNEDIDLLLVPFSVNDADNKQQFQLIHNKIFDEIKTSILVIPNSYKFSPTTQIVFATDLKDHSFYELYLNEILKFAKIFNAHIHFVHVLKNESDLSHKKSNTYKTIIQIVENNKNHCLKTIASKDIVSAIQKYSEDNNINLISVVKAELNIIGELFHKSISDQTITTSKVPVLFMKEKKHWR